MMNNNFFRMINEDFVTYNENLTLLPQVKESLREEIATEVEKYDWEVGNYEGIDAILDEWWENKGRPMTEMFGGHPNYVKGKFMIVLKGTKYFREISNYAMLNFKNYVMNVIYKRYVEKYRDSEDPEKINNTCKTPFTYINEYGWGEFNIFKEDYIVANDVEKIFRTIDRYIYNGFITKSMVDKISVLDNTFHIHNGMKATKYVGKVCRELGICNDENYNRSFTEFCDGFSPKELKRTTVISWNPLDYLRMSMGNSWASCHTIDKRNDDDGYGGMYCGGTLSYMLDSSSIEFYTVYDEYDGNDFELQPKIERCMFYIDKEKNYFIQSRLYPQCNDGALGIYKSVREIVQEVVSECWNVNNSWLVSRGTENCSKLIITKGTHYPDYNYFSECNVSYNKNVPDVKNKAKKITVGHGGICITCGVKHFNSNSIACKEHSIAGTFCYECGCIIDEDDGYYSNYNGEYYCCDCVTYCECCEEWYPNDMVRYVKGYGYVCDTCANNSIYFTICENCGEVIYTEDSNAVCTEDGYYFCESTCAEASGYVYVENEKEYYYKDKVEYCNECEEWVLKEDYDEEHGMCINCVDDLNSELNEAV